MYRFAGEICRSSVQKCVKQKCVLMVALEEAGGPSENAGQEVVICQPRSVCAKFGIDWGNGCGDKGREKSVT